MAGSFAARHSVAFLAVDRAATGGLESFNLGRQVLALSADAGVSKRRSNNPSEERPDLPVAPPE